MVFLFCWMAEAWLPPQWVLIAGGLSTLMFFVRHYWFDSYWGGSLGACGGALVLGALGYVLRGRWSRGRWSFGLGALVLYLTRPYEGGVLCLGTLIVLAIHFRRFGGERKRAFARAVILPNAALLAVAAALVGWYNHQITGHATEPPYVLFMRQQDSTPVLWVMPPPSPKQYGYASLRNQHQWEWEGYQRVRQTPLHRALTMQFLFFLVSGVWQQFLAFGALLFAAPWARMQGRKKWLILLLSLGVVALLLESFSMSHYSAPFTPVILVLIVASARALWYRLAAVRWRGLAFIAATCILFTFTVFDYQRVFMTPRVTPRGKFLRQLESKGGRHLVFVDYAEGWSGWIPNAEWIYNGADLETSPVVFAHLRSDAENRELMQAYPGRTAWSVLLGPEPEQVRVQSYGER